MEQKTGPLAAFAIPGSRTRRDGAAGQDDGEKKGTIVVRAKQNPNDPVLSIRILGSTTMACTGAVLFRLILRPLPGSCAFKLHMAMVLPKSYSERG